MRHVVATRFIRIRLNWSFAYISNITGFSAEEEKEINVCSSWMRPASFLLWTSSQLLVADRVESSNIWNIFISVCFSLIGNLPPFSQNLVHSSDVEFNLFHRHKSSGAKNRGRLCNRSNGIRQNRAEETADISSSKAVCIHYKFQSSSWISVILCHRSVLWCKYWKQ